MELFWFVFIRVCWALGLILAILEIICNKSILKKVQESKLTDAPGLMILLSLALTIFCALWPIWTGAELFIKIGRGIKER